MKNFTKKNFNTNISIEASEQSIAENTDSKNIFKNIFIIVIALCSVFSLYFGYIGVFLSVILTVIYFFYFAINKNTKLDNTSIKKVNDLSVASDFTAQILKGDLSARLPLRNSSDKNKNSNLEKLYLNLNELSIFLDNNFRKIFPFIQQEQKVLNDFCDIKSDISENLTKNLNISKKNLFDLEQNLSNIQKLVASLEIFKKQKNELLSNINLKINSNNSALESFDNWKNYIEQTTAHVNSIHLITDDVLKTLNIFQEYSEEIEVLAFQIEVLALRVQPHEPFKIVSEEIHRLSNSFLSSIPQIQSLANRLITESSQILTNNSLSFNEALSFTRHSDISIDSEEQTKEIILSIEDLSSQIFPSIEKENTFLLNLKESIEEQTQQIFSLLDKNDCFNFNFLKEENNKKQEFWSRWAHQGTVNDSSDKPLSAK